MCLKICPTVVAWLSLLFLSDCALIGYDSLPVQVEGGSSKTSPAGGETQHGGGATQEVSGGTVGGSGGNAKTGGAIAPETGGNVAVTGGAGDTTTGGVASGGSVDGTGGVSTGGIATGGVATGGVATGGVATGGVATGGVATGGVATGGVATGGVATGGVATGGMTTGGSDVEDSGVPDAGPPIVYNSLLHRYDFSDVGTTVTDLVGNADGVQYDDTPMSGLGYADFDGVDDYVQLPGNLVTQVQDFTLMAWIVWDGADCGATIFSFGDNNGPADQQGSMISTIGTTPESCSLGVGAAAGFLEPNTLIPPAIYKSQSANQGSRSFVAVTVSRSTGRWRIDLDGRGSQTNDNKSLPSGMSSWVDNKNWLGQGQVDGDYPRFGGLIEEFRIYDRALTTTEVENCRTLGPDDPCDP